MKKFLLLSCAALATVTANAQDYKMANIDFGKTQSMAMKAITPAPQRSNMEITPALKSAVKDMSAIKNKMAKAPALSNLDGDYIEHYLGTDTQPCQRRCNLVQRRPADQEIQCEVPA